MKLTNVTFQPILVCVNIVFAASLLVSSAVFAQPDELLSDDELQKAFEEAAKQFRAGGSVSMDEPEGGEAAVPETVDLQTLMEEEGLAEGTAQEEVAEEAPQTEEVEPVAQASPEAEEIAEKAPSDAVGEKEHDVEIMPVMAYQARHMEPGQGFTPLDSIELAVNVENQSVQAIVDQIVAQAAEKTGPWQVKWRLRKEHEYLLTQRVNLTAETTFGEFMDYLVERVNNMTGIHLFVSRFNASRILVISDTYY